MFDAIASLAVSTHTVHKRDRQTDRQTDTARQQRPRYIAYRRAIINGGKPTLIFPVI